MAETFDPGDLQRIIEHANYGYEDAHLIRARMTTLEQQDAQIEATVEAINLVRQVKDILDGLDALALSVSSAQGAGQVGVKKVEYEIEFTSSGTLTGVDVGYYNRRMELLGKLERLLKISVNWQSRTEKNDLSRTYSPSIQRQ